MGDARHVRINNSKAVRAIRAANSGGGLSIGFASIARQGTLTRRNCRDYFITFAAFADEACEEMLERWEGNGSAATNCTEAVSRDGCDACSLPGANGDCGGGCADGESASPGESGAESDGDCNEDANCGQCEDCKAQG